MLQAELETAGERCRDRAPRELGREELPKAAQSRNLYSPLARRITPIPAHTSLPQHPSPAAALLKAQPWGSATSKDSDLPAGTWWSLQGKGSQETCVCILHWVYFPTEACSRTITAGTVSTRQQPRQAELKAPRVYHSSLISSLHSHGGILDACITAVLLEEPAAGLLRT